MELNEIQVGGVVEETASEVFAKTLPVGSRFFILVVTPILGVKESVVGKFTNFAVLQDLDPVSALERLLDIIDSPIPTQ